MNVINFLVLLSLHVADGAKVLFLPLQQGSHANLQQSIVSEMRMRGHDVYTVIGTTFGAKFKDKIIQPGGKILWFEQNPARTITGANCDELFADLLNDFSIANQRRTMAEAFGSLYGDCEDMMTDDTFLQRIRQIHFDMAVIDYVQGLPCLLLLPHNLSIPFLVHSVGVSPWSMREPALPSVVPSMYSNKGQHMTFWERLENMYEHWSFYHMPSPGRHNTSLLDIYAPGTNWWSELLEASQLFIQIRDHILEYPQPTMPNNIRLFGLSYRKARPLTGKLAEYVLNSTNDIIVVSFGSMGGKLPQKYVNKLLQTFERFDYTFIFSYSGGSNDLQDLPPNVHTFPWLPQNDIMGHNKTKLFITHAGHNGQSEAIFHGVPMVNMPLYFEQFHNAFRVQDHEYGLTVNIYDFTPQRLYDVIHEVLTNRKYRDNVERASRIVRSQRESKQVAADWIEHVLRFGGAHLRPSALDMPWYQYFMLDILVVLLIVSFICVVLFVFALRTVCAGVRKATPIKTKQQ